MPQRTNLLIQDFILGNKSPTSFTQIQDFLVTQNINVNKTTIYRNLEKLEQEDKIRKVLLSDQKQFWEKNPLDNGHCHLICEKCQKVECVELKSPISFPSNDFQTSKVELNLVGLCKNCQTSNQL
jgi:Fe2+ or Zn2+ uptake regulation protein